jgi:hypothetical protein
MVSQASERALFGRNDFFALRHLRHAAGDAAEEGHERPSLGLVELAAKACTQRFVVRPHFLEKPPSFRRERCGASPPIGRMRRAHEDAAAFEQIQHGADGVRIGRKPPHEFLLGQGFFLSERRQEDELIRRYFRIGQVRVGPPVHRQIGRTQRHGNLMAAFHVDLTRDNS